MIAEPTADPARLQAMAEAVGLEADELRYVIAGPEAGKQAGAAFFRFQRDGFGLAVREDGSSLCLTALPSPFSMSALTALVEELGLENPRVPGTSELSRAREQSPMRWVALAAAPVSKATEVEAVEWFHPRRDGQSFSTQALVAVSERFADLLAAVSPPVEGLVVDGLALVTPGDVVGRVSGVSDPGNDVFGQALVTRWLVDGHELVLGAGLDLQDGQLKAARCGYLCLSDGCLVVRAPVWLDPDGSEAWWLLCASEPAPVSVKLVRDALNAAGVTYGVDQDALRQLSRRLKAGAECGSLRVALAFPPVHGQDAKVEFLVDMTPRVGRERADGTTDFDSASFRAGVEAGQLLARRMAPTEGEAGCNVRGRPVDPRPGEDRPLVAGDNVRVEFRDGVEHFFAEVGGAVRRRADELSVRKVLVLDGNVSFDTGNLDFGGEIHVGGSVLPGFAVKADGDVTVAGMVESGAAVLSRGDVVVGHGIVGRKTRVTARGAVRAAFVTEGRVIAGGDIDLGRCASHAYLRSGGVVRVARGEGKGAGSIVGGEAWVRSSIIVFFAGSPAGVPTMLVAGLDPDEAAKLDKLRRSVASSQDHILRLLRKFGLAQLDVGQIKNMIAAAIGPQRKVLARAARQLGELVQLRQRVLMRVRELEGQIGTDVEDVRVDIHQRAFPGVTVRIGDVVQTLETDLKAPCFRLRDGAIIHTNGGPRD